MFQFLSFQFPPHWPSHIHTFAVFSRQIPIPKNWLKQRSIEDAYHPFCNCHTYQSQFLQDPAVSSWYLGICPSKYPYVLILSNTMLQP